MALAYRIFLFNTSWMLIMTGASCQYYGKLLGTFITRQHGVQGTVYAANERTFYIKGFTYDGEGPYTHFWAGNTNDPSAEGFVVPDETGRVEKLRSYRNEDIIITLPIGKTIQDIKWISVWCEHFAANFGEVLVPFEFEAPRPQNLGALPTFAHKLSSGPVIVKDEKTIFIPRLIYDGAAPDAFWLVGNGSTITYIGAIKVPFDKQKPGSESRVSKGYLGDEDVTLYLPDDLTIFGIDWLSMYCIQYKQDFGSVMFPKDMNIPSSIIKKRSTEAMGSRKGNRIGEFQTNMSGTYGTGKVRGTVYAASPDTLFIENFSFNGDGIPEAFFFAGASSLPSEDGFKVPVQLLSTKPLHNYEDSSLILPLPNGKNLKDIKWFSVFLSGPKESLGYIIIPDNFQAPKEQEINEIPNLAHGTHSGKVVIKDSKTIFIPNLYYDGAAPDAFFLVGMGKKPSTKGIKIPDENESLNKLKGYQGKNITLVLPGNLTVYDIDWFSLFCITYKENFGHVLIPKNLNVPANKNDLLALAHKEPKFENCVVIFKDQMQVYWKILGDTIVIKIEGIIDQREYLSFGLSGDEKKTSMIGADVVLAFYDKSKRNARVVDYDLSAKSQCDGEKGACPDTTVGGTDDVEIISYNKQDGVSSFTYKRLLNTGDNHDKSFKISGEQLVVGAIGSINSETEAAIHSEVTRTALWVKFGGTSNNLCPSLFDAAKSGETPNEEDDIGVWKIQTIKDTKTFEFQIGPPGGKKGYTAITGFQSWGISWWVNGLLIPEITVVRGKNYTFIVEGGNSLENPASYHPLYITNNIEGGVGQKTIEIESPENQVYAGLKKDPATGNFKPIGVGRFCEFKSNTVDMSSRSRTFEDFKKTLTLQCDTEDNRGIFYWTPDKNTPNLVYYQCFSHRNMGWKIHVTGGQYGNYQSNGLALILCLLISWSSASIFS